jgi:hypothetical protein
MFGHVLQKVQQVVHSKASQLDPNWDTASSHMTEIEMLMAMKQALTKVCSVKSKNLVERIKLVMDMDEKSYRKMQELTHNYLKLINKNKELKEDVALAAYDYLRQLYTTYSTLLSEYQQKSSPVLNAEKLNMLLARYLNAAFMMNKWRYFDDQPAPVGVWRNVHQVIKIAEELTMMNKDLFLYDFQNKETSLATILKRGFMLNTLQKESYTPVQIELTDRVLKTWSTNPKISNRYTTKNEYQFFIHLDEDKGPKRLRSAKQHPEFRYWKTDRIVDLMETYLCAVDTGKSLAQFNLVTKANTEDLVRLFKKLRVDWCIKGYKRQRREEERVAKFSVLNVSHGFDQIRLHILYLDSKTKHVQSVTEEGYQALSTEVQYFKAHQTSQQSSKYVRENWVMLEESAQGFSVEFGKKISDWVKSGALIGYSTSENIKHVALAEIKTVRKITNGHHRVGLSKLCSNAVLLTINKVEKNTLSRTVAGYIDGDEKSLVVLDEFSGFFIDDDRAEKPRLIVPRYQYKRASRYRVTMNGGYITVLAGDVVSSHREWICFDVIV